MSLDFKQYPILFVDDEEANRVVFRATFHPEFEVICVSSAAEALLVLEKQPVAILVTD